MIVFGIHCNFFFVLPNRPKTCRSNGFFLFYKAKCARPKNWALLRGFACPSAPNRQQVRNLSRSDEAFLKTKRGLEVVSLPHFLHDL